MSTDDDTRSEPEPQGKFGAAAPEQTQRQAGPDGTAPDEARLSREEEDERQERREKDLLSRKHEAAAD